MENTPGGHPRARVALAVAALALLQAGLSYRQVRDLAHPGNYDTAYYYTVARNLATGRGLTESMAWHYLGPATPIARPAGDCWMVGWPLVLGAIMTVVGHSGVDALRICAGLSVLLPIVAFALSWGLRPRLGTALLAGLLVCAQPRLYQSNVTPDVTLSYQLFALFGLIFGLDVLRGDVSRARCVWAGVALALPVWLRGEGFVGLLAVALALLIGGEGSRRARLVRAGWLMLGAACGVAPLYLYHLAAFGRLNPVPRSLTFWVRDIDELYTLDTDPSFASWRSQGAWRIGSERVRCVRALVYNLLIQVPWPLLLAAAAGVVTGLSRRRVKVLGLALFLVLSAAVPVTLVPYFTNPDRLVMHALPVLCVLAASAVGDVDDLTREKPRRVRAGALATSALVVAGCVFVPARLDSSGHFEHGWQAQFRPVPAALVAAARALGVRPGDVVLTQDPWQVAAVLDVPTVMIPYDGPDAFGQVVERYRPRFVVLPDGSSKGANPKIARHFAGNRARLEALGYRPVLRTDGDHWYERRTPGPDRGGGS